MDLRQKRKCDLEKLLIESYEQLNRHERELLWAENPQSHGKLKHQINELRKKIDDWQQELDSLEQRPTPEAESTFSLANQDSESKSKEDRESKLNIAVLVQNARLLQLSPDKIESVKQFIKHKFEHEIQDIKTHIDKVNAELENNRQSIKNAEENVQEAKESFDRREQLYEEFKVRESKLKELELQKQELENKHQELEDQLKLQEKELLLVDEMSLLAKDMHLDIQSIQQFFSGQSVKRDEFIKICEKLNQRLDEIVDIGFLEMHVLVVPRLRSRHYNKIQDQCGTMKLLDISQPVDLNNLYVDVNILEELASYQHVGIPDLPQVLNPKTDEFDRFGLGKVLQARIPGLKAVEEHSKLMVLGKPGAGKSTFLQYIAIQCNKGEFQPDYVPIFIRLKAFAEDARDAGDFSLFNYISKDFSNTGVSAKNIDTVFNYGKALILLDGLDEVPEKDSKEILKQIRRFSEQYYKNKLIVTCRIAANQYRFPGFTDVEVADFDDKQIESFVKRWFITVARTEKEQGLVKAKSFIKKLNLPKNQPIRELVVTPILLNLTCLVFHGKADFPYNRSTLYEEGLEILLRRWDETRFIKRDDVYRNLSLENKKDLLTYVAATTFEKSHYFFEQDEIQQCIAKYLRTLPSTQIQSLLLQRDSEAVLKSIEAQHGLLIERARRIYSFSHLTFQEYFTARAIFTNPKTTELLDNSINTITKKSWREVFLLATEMFGNADYMLLLKKKKIDALIALDQQLQRFMGLVRQKSLSVNVPYKPAAIRAFYFSYCSNLLLDPDLACDLDLARNLDPALANKYSRDFSDFTRNRDPYRAHNVLGQSWQISRQQKELLKQYYNENKLLLDCMNSGCNVTAQVRSQIEDTLLLPIAEIEKKRQ